MIRRLVLGMGLAAAFLSAAPAARTQEEKQPQDGRQDLKEKTEKYKKDVTALRALEFKRDVTVGMYSKKELLEFLKGEFEKELPKDKAEKFQRGYAKFGLIPESMNLYEAYLDLLSSSIAGFYHPKTKELRLVRSGEDDGGEGAQLKALGIDMEAITLVHELTHAAQDQNFELSTLPLEDETNDDLIMALKGLIEGDASAIGWKWQFKDRFDLAIGTINKGYQMGVLPGKANELPAYLKLTLTFPYGHGTDFVVKTLKGSEGGLKDATKLFQDFPLSSEQILHPEKYSEKRDNPMLVTLPDLAALFGGGWKESFNNVHGEFAVQILLKEFRGDKLRLGQIRRASEGWDGDRYVVLEDEKNVAMYVWASTWDTEEDAKEFYEAYAAALEKKYEQAGPEADRPDRTAFKSPKGQVLLERKGQDVLVLDGATDAMLAKTDAVWRGLRKVEMTGVERLKKFVCAKDGVKEAFSGKCAKCGTDLKFDDEKKDPKKRRDYFILTR
jgi:hypothetical protein